MNGLTNKKTAEYLGVAESFELPAGGDVSERVVIVDAISRRQIHAIQESSRAQDSEITSQFSPLLLGVKGEAARRLAEIEGWFSLTVSDTPQPGDDGFEASPLVFGETEGEPDARGLWCRIGGREPSRIELATLSRLAEVRQVESNLDEEVSATRDPAAVAVYDVGQASFSALVDRYEHPIMFFDLGWPINFNKHSGPSVPNFDPFALDHPNSPAPVVLSHLDWDHWGFACKSGRAVWDPSKGEWKTEVVYRAGALQRPWMIRRPRFKRHKLSASHIHLIQKLRETILPDGNRALRLYPSRKWSHRYGPTTLIRCSAAGLGKTGPSFLRNNEGLAVHVTGAGRKVLYCGDAEFGAVPARFLKSLTGVIAPHHGGDIDLSAMPAPAVNKSLMAVSTYPGCYSNVPSADIEKHAVSLGWQWRVTSARKVCGRGGCSRGNMLVPLGMTPRCGCRGVDANCLCLH